MRQQGSVTRPWPCARVLLGTIVLQCTFLIPWRGDAACVPEKGCETAYAFYRVQQKESLADIGQKFRTTQERIQEVNPSIGDGNHTVIGTPLYIPLQCDCISDQLVAKFHYQVLKGDSVDSITTIIYENLTQQNWIVAWNSLPDAKYIQTGSYLDIPVNCSCGNPASSDYGLFLTYPVVAGTGGNVSGIASDFNTTTEFLKKFNPGIIWENSQPTQYAFIPVTDPSGNYLPYQDGTSSAEKSANSGVIAGAVIAGLVVLFTLLALVYYLRVSPPRKLQQKTSSKPSSNPGRGASVVPTALADYAVDNSVEFTYGELANATDGFSVAKKIGEGGFAVVFYGEIRGQKLAIKRMNLQATKEFMAELQVLTHVHHTNLVQLIGYCTTDYLFLVYEFVENGTLHQHLQSAKAGEAPLSWSSRVQIALDAARGLEYIHEHTKPNYIHRDIKSANILLDKRLHAKVADFGLAKLTDTNLEENLTSRVVGTWGYMSPEYAQYGDVSPMLDVYSFGVVLFEILSGREAVMRGGLADDTSSSTPRSKEEQRALVTLFDPVLKAPNGKEKLPKFMDPNLHDDYPPDAAWKLAQLARACTEELSDMRPTMRKAVVALMTLSSKTQDWEVSSFARDGAR